MMNPSLVFPKDMTCSSYNMPEEVDITTGGGRIPPVICGKAKR
jgi:hypothetical protein